MAFFFDELGIILLFTFEKRQKNEENFLIFEISIEKLRRKRYNKAYNRN